MRVKRHSIAALTLLAVVAWGALLWGYAAIRINQQLALAHEQVSAAFQALMTGYAEFADTAMSWLLSDADVELLMQRTTEGDVVARGLLYRQWAPTYELLQTKDVRQLHFIDRNGNSQLRMHAPHRSGDNLLSVRPMIRRALERQEALSGFENGRIFSGFRFIRPVSAGAKPLGVVEIGLSFAAFRRLLEADLGTGTVVRFLLRRDDLERTTQNFEGEDVSTLLDSLYMPALGGQAFVSENVANPLFGRPQRHLPGYAAALEQALGAVPAVRAAMADGRAMKRAICLGPLECYRTDLVPIRTSANDAVAYLLVYARMTDLQRQVVQLLSVFGTGVVVLIGTVMLWTNYRRTRLQLAAISQHAGKGIYVIDARGTIIYANPATSAILGYDNSELVRHNAHQLFHHESAGGVVHSLAKCPIRQVTDTGQVFHGGSEVFRHKDGDLIPVEVTASPIVEHGEIVSVVTVFDDIRRRLAAQATMLESSAAFEQTVEGLMITDANQVITRVNTAFTKATGYTAADAVGRTPRLLSSGEHSREFYATMHRQLEKQGVWQGEIRNRRKNGEVYPEWLSISVVRDDRQRVTSYVAVFRDISDVKEKERRLEHLAHYDALTDLPNRSLLKELLQHAVERSRRRHRRLCLMFMDIDRFKQVNDSLGHEVGDDLLRQVVDRLTVSLRNVDTLARWGGDEFVVILDDMEQVEHSNSVAQKLIGALREPFHFDGHEVFVGASIGMANFPEDGDTGDKLLRAADAAMYQAKAAGGNTYRQHSAGDHDDPSEQLRIEAELRHALKDDEMELYYQPKLNLHSGEVESVEALVRWNHPQRGVLTPNLFLPAVEKARMGRELGDWVMAAAMRQLAAWSASGLDLAVCINVDGCVLGQEGFAAQVRAGLQAHGIKADRFGIEITETAISQQPDHVVADLKALMHMGVGLSIDDFGTGHSSLTRLKMLPFRALKIDRSFVRDMLVDRSDRAIVRATIALAHELDLKVVAEGVETEAQLTALGQMGCDSIQGYLFARPMPAKALAAFLADRPQVVGEQIASVRSVPA